MNRLFAGLIFLLAIIVSGCAEPIGNFDGTGGSGGKTEYEFLMLRPNRILYDVDGGSDGRFDRKADLRVFVADGGSFKAIDPYDNNLVIEVVLNPGMISETTSIVNSYFPFSEPGRHIIRGTYNGKTDEYSIEVRGYLSNPGGDGSGFVDIIWL